MATKHTTHIPMVPEDRPEQWINEVIELSKLPEGFEIEIAWGGRVGRERAWGTGGGEYSGA